ncbi:sugar isomerase domain-containing protein [Agrococcus sp. ProA11]|uniref:sugar isomerase domain-containing protein n=1 Tax=Agrococcus chionoecetis TaxID=3153752 RepID=UPI0032601BAB
MTTFGAFVDQVIDANTEPLERAAHAVLATLRADGLVRTAGAGHSLAAVMESFYRAGGLAQVRPLWHPSLLPLGDAAGSTRGERQPGLGLDVVARAGVEARDTVVVFSSSGINHFPVEVAHAAASAGATVIAVTSVGASRAAEPRAGARLFELASIVLDTRAPVGDVSRPSADPITAPVSSLATNALWSALLERVVLLEPDAPLWRSANVAGNDDANAALIARLSARIPELGSA